MTSAPSFAAVASAQSMWYFDLRPYFNYFERPDRSTLGAAARSIFPSDPALGFAELRGRMAGCYRLASTTQPTCQALTLQRKIRTGSGGFEDVSVPLRPFSGSGDSRREGTLITIVDGDLGAAHAIPGGAFDAAMGVYGEVVMRTKPQKDKESGLFNNNRMLVVDTENSKNPLPDRLVVNGISFLIKYKGKKWMCSSCSVEHVGACPYLKSFYEALEKKKTVSVNHAVVADSTLRQADHVGLAADVMCMPGATVGQLATAYEFIPKDYGKVSIVAGANDCHTRDQTSEFIVAKRIDKSLNRFASVAEERRDTIKFSYLNSMPPSKDCPPLEKFARLYLKERVRKVLRKLDNVDVLKGVQYPEDWTEDGHPTEGCTEAMLRSLASDCPNFVLNEDFITTEHTYRGVEKCWVSCCSGCPARGSYRDAFCPDCMSDIFDNDSYDDFNLVKKLSEKVFSEDFPERKRRHDSLSSQGSDSLEAKVQIVDQC